MTRRKKPKDDTPQASDSPAVKRRKQERLMRAVQSHLDESGDYSIAVWSHRWSLYTMDDMPGLWRLFNGDYRSIDGKEIVAAWSVSTSKWQVFIRLSDDETAKVIEEKIELENLPF